MPEFSKLTNAQTLGSLIKSCRDIMRKDKGLSTDIDRLPMLTWLMFLKFLDDLEPLREAEANMAGKRFHPSIDPPYRWRDWAARPDGITGDALISFINNDEATRPDGTHGPGLFAYLRSLHSANGDRRDVIGAVFQGTVNRMLSGYLLRDVINKINGIHFTSTEEIYTLGHLYESMLKEMRDAAGENGEFYTPRPVVQFMVNAVNPRLGETILDPACGTGGFLASTFEHLRKQCKTAGDQRRLQRDSLYGIEAKPLPYLLCQMNLLLHGLEYPNIDPLNALRFPLREIGEKDRVDVILTNPPFGGEEEKGIQGNFPEDKKTNETAVLFLQLIMRKLRRPIGGKAGGRCAIVSSDGLLSTKGVCARVKSELVNNFNLHTIVRLPKGVFSPYTPIKTNILFFDSSSRTKGVWFYELPPPKGRQMYSKTKPLNSEDFDECIKWWESREQNERAWFVPIDVILNRDMDLDIPNPNNPLGSLSMEPCQILSMISTTGKEVQQELATIQQFFPKVPRTIKDHKPVVLGEALSLRRNYIIIDDETKYQLVTVQLHGRGIKPRSTKLGGEIKVKNQQPLKYNDLVVAEIDAKMGGYGVVPLELAGSIVSSHYFVYEVDSSKIDLGFLEWFLRSGLPEVWIQPFVKGSTNYAAIRQNHFMLLELRLPPLPAQKDFVNELAHLSQVVEEASQRLKILSYELSSLIPSILDEAYNHKRGKI